MWKGFLPNFQVFLGNASLFLRCPTHRRLTATRIAWTRSGCEAGAGAGAFADLFGTQSHPVWGRKCRPSRAAFRVVVWSALQALQLRSRTLVRWPHSIDLLGRVRVLLRLIGALRATYRPFSVVYCCLHQVRPGVPVYSFPSSGYSGTALFHTGGTSLSLCLLS